MTTNNVTIGLDLGDRTHAACVLSASGDIVAETDIVNTRACLTTFAARYPQATVIMETDTLPCATRVSPRQGWRRSR